MVLCIKIPGRTKTDMKVGGIPTMQVVAAGKNDAHSRKLDLKTTLNVHYLITNGLTLEKITWLNESLKFKRNSIFFIAEIGPRWMQVLQDTGWHTTKQPENRSEGLASKLSNDIHHLLSEVIQTNSRFLSLRLKTTRQDRQITGIYAPHEGRKKSEYEEFLQQLGKTIERQNNIITIGDFNAKIGRQQAPVTSRYGIHHFDSRNGKLLHEFARQRYLCVANSHFKTGKKRHKKNYTIFTCKHATYRSKNLDHISELDLALTRTPQIKCISQVKVSWKEANQI